MKFLSLVILFLSSGALAFDSTAWLERRVERGREALRLRAAYSNAVARVSEPAENLCVPVEVHPDGSVKTSIRARRAQVFVDSNLVWGEGVVVSQYDEAGRETLRIESSTLLFDRERKRGWVEGTARVTRGKSVFSGENVYFSTEEEYVLAFKASAMESRDLEIGGAL